MALLQGPLQSHTASPAAVIHFATPCNAGDIRAATKGAFVRNYWMGPKTGALASQ